jgi:hypothetical protein
MPTEFYLKSYKMEIKYKFYATLLDKYHSYCDSSELYQQFWGFSEDPTKTEEEFEKEQFDSLLNTINRVPFESELADKGTAFNEVVDCIIEKRTSDKMEIKSYAETKEIWVNYKTHLFKFPLDLCKEFAEYFKGALTQQRVDGILETKYGNVEVYGFIDTLMPFKIADIKTTGKYFAGKYRKNWQHIVYPFCLNQNGVLINEFEYAVTDFKNSWTEFYVFRPEIDLPRLVEHCESLIEFLEQNKDLIIDRKIFAKE